MLQGDRPGCLHLPSQQHEKCLRSVLIECIQPCSSELLKILYRQACPQPMLAQNLANLGVKILM